MCNEDLKNIGRKSKEMILTRTPEEDAKIKKLYNSGVSIASIAREFGVSRQVMIARIKKLGIWFKNKTPVNSKKIINLCVVQNCTLSEIEQRTGWSKVSIHHVLKEANLKCRRDKGPAARTEIPKEILHELFIVRDMTARELSKIFNTGISNMRDRLKDAGIKKERYSKKETK